LEHKATRRIAERTSKRNVFVDKTRRCADSAESSMSSAALVTIIARAIVSNQMRTTGSMTTSEMTFRAPIRAASNKFFHSVMTVAALALLSLGEPYASVLRIFVKVNEAAE
jgi:hypothetical protein